MTSGAGAPTLTTVAMAARDLACARGSAVLFEGLSLDLAPGAGLVVRGPNGSGKTTLLRVLAGFASPAAGHITLSRSEETITDEAGRRECVCYLGHATGLKPALSPAETLTFWAHLYGRDISVADLLERISLSDRADLPVRVLSAGQKQRLALARTQIAAQPVWVLDEPTASLDDRSAALVSRWVGAHRARGGIVIAAVHGAFDMADALVCRIGTREAA